MHKNRWKRTVALGSAVAMTIPMAACGNQATIQENQNQGASAEAAQPNVVYLVLDDVGFGDLGCYGSSVSTPNMDALAAQGIQYTNYITSPMSSPARASMLTGFESNFVGMGSVADLNIGNIAPNLAGNIQPKCGFITHSLRENNYGTMSIGKWHLASYDQFTPDGDKTTWPSGRGFDKNYSFVGSQVNQFEPGGIFEGDEYVVPDTSAPDYHLTHNIIDKALQYIDETSEEQPFFAHVALGAMHGPFNVAQEYIDKYKGAFDEGWDAEREKIFARQKELGIFDKSTEMAQDASYKVPAWDELTETQKQIARRHMEVYAGFLEYTDMEIGRFITALKERGELDNTLILLVSDNGANSNGGDNGSLIAHDNENLKVREPEEMVQYLDQFGSETYGTQYNAGWAMVSNTPFQHFKASGYNGGVRTMCIASWENGITEPGRLNNDLIAVPDLAATVLDVTNTTRLTEIEGVRQYDMQGMSFADTFASADVRKNPRTTYAEMMFLDWSYTADGYTIVRHPKTGALELYDVENDQAQAHNLADKMPEKLQEMKEKFDKARKEEMDAQNLFMDIAHGVSGDVLYERYGELAVQVTDLMQKGAEPTTPELAEYSNVLKAMMFTPSDMPNGYKGVGMRWYQPPTSRHRAKAYTYANDYLSFAMAAVPTNAVSHKIKTTVIGKDAEGVIFAYGGSDGGFGLYVKDGKLIYVNNAYNNFQKVVSSKALEDSENAVEIEYTKTSYRTGDVQLAVNDEVVGTASVQHLPIFTSYDYFSVGRDAGSKVSDDYTDEFAFTGEIGDVHFEIGDDQFINQ